MRFCVNCKRLDSLPKTCLNPIHSVEECFDSIRMDSIRYESVIYKKRLNNVYWELKIVKKKRDKIASTSFHKPYGSILMPFELRCAPVTAQPTMDGVLSSTNWRCLLVYLEDIGTFSTYPKKHMDHAR